MIINWNANLIRSVAISGEAIYVMKKHFLPGFLKLTFGILYF